MADAFIQVALDGAGKQVDAASLTVNSTTVYRQRTVLGDNANPTYYASISSAGALKVDGSAVTQPVSISSVVQVGGALVNVLLSPTSSTSAYSSGHVLGGILTFSAALRTNGGSGYAVNARMTSKLTTFTGPVDLFLFARNPAGTYTDRTAFDLSNSTDQQYFMGVLHLNDLTPAGSSMAILESQGPWKPIRNDDSSPGTAVYAVAVTRAGATFANTTSFTFALVSDNN